MHYPKQVLVPFTDFLLDQWQKWRQNFPLPQRDRCPYSLSPHDLGKWGEQQAAKFLKSRPYRYKILYRNFQPSASSGEIDLVCRNQNVLVFVEVKTRKNIEQAAPSLAVNLHKQKLLRQGAKAWMHALAQDKKGISVSNICYRFDIVEVWLNEKGHPEFRLLKNAF